MRFEEALSELRKGRKIQMSSRDWIIFSLEDEHGYCLGVNDFVNEDWQVTEESGKTFPEVFEAFKEGKKIKRKKWKIEGDEDYLHICTARILHVNDLLGTDWVIIEE